MPNPSLYPPDKPFRFPQYCLRTLFLVVAGCGAFFAILGAIGLLASIGLMVVVTIVCLHVLGNVLGRQLRNQPTLEAEPTELPVTMARHNRLTSIVPLDNSRLFERTPIGWTNRIFCVLGALAGGALGTEALVLWDSIRLPGLVLGATSSAVLGGFSGFLIGGFLEMMLRAWWQAASEPKRAKTSIVFAPLSSAADRADIE